MAAKYKWKRKKHDWEAIEREYRMGQKSLRTLADEFGLSASSISRRAAKYKWVQDKATEIRVKTQAGLIAQQKTQQSLQCNGKRNAVAPDTGNPPTSDDIERAVRTNIEVIKSHRKAIGRNQRIVDLLASQLEVAAQTRDELSKEIDTETAEDKTAYRRAQLKKAISLPAHAAVLRDLSTAQKNLITMERQAFNLDAQLGSEGNPFHVAKHSMDLSALHKAITGDK